MVCVGANDDTPPANCGGQSFRSRVEFVSTSDVTYYVYVTGFGSSSYGATQLNVSCTDPAARNGSETVVVEEALTTELAGWSMYPNPAKDRVSLDLSNYISSDVTVRVIDYTGKVITTKELTNLKATGYTLELNTNLPDGMYIVQLTTAEGTSAKKLVIVK